MDGLRSRPRRRILLAWERNFAKERRSRGAESDPFHPAELYATREGIPPAPPLASLYAAAVHAAGMIRAFVFEEQALASCGRIVRIDALGRPHSIEVAPHPQCGCGAAGLPFSADDAAGSR